MIPPRAGKKKLPRTALAFVVAAVLLAIILALAAARGLRREDKMMRDFLTRQGLTLIRTFEAGARTTMRHHMGNGDPLATLVSETGSEEGIVYILIIDDNGHTVARAGKDVSPTAGMLKSAMTDNRPVTRLDRSREIFEVGRRFHPLGPHPRPMMRRRWQRWCRKGRPQPDGDRPEFQNNPPPMAVMVGLDAAPFIANHRDNLRQTLIAGAILLLAGSAGFYFILLRQDMDSTRAALSNMESYTGSVISSMPAGLIALDRKGRVVALNPQAEEITGLKKEKVKNRSLTDLLGTRPEWLDQEKEISGLAVEWPRADGTAVPIELGSAPVSGGNDENLGRVLLLRDMREIRVMEEKLERSRRLAALGKMAAGIAHEIRNPLGTIRGFAQYINGRSDDEKSKEYAHIMINEADRLNQAVSALLQFAKPREPEISRFPAAELVQRTAALMAADIEAAGLTLSMNCPGDIHCRGDRDLLLQVLINLVKNAVEAGPAGSEIRISCGRKGDAISLAVSDQGPGMDETVKERIFDPFFTTRKQGTGLGLAISHQIAESHGGRIEVASSPGAGATVTLIIPS